MPMSANEIRILTNDLYAAGMVESANAVARGSVTNDEKEFWRLYHMVWNMPEARKSARWGKLLDWWCQLTDSQRLNEMRRNRLHSIYGKLILERPYCPLSTEEVVWPAQTRNQTDIVGSQQIRPVPANQKNAQNKRNINRQKAAIAKQQREIAKRNSFRNKRKQENPGFSRFNNVSPVQGTRPVYYDAPSIPYVYSPHVDERDLGFFGRIGKVFEGVETGRKWKAPVSPKNVTAEKWTPVRPNPPGNTNEIKSLAELAHEYEKAMKPQFQFKWNQTSMKPRTAPTPQPTTVRSRGKLKFSR